MYHNVCPPVIMLPPDTFILDMKHGDVNGDRIIDNVYLVGKKPSGPDSPFRDNIAIIVHDCSTNQLTTIPLKENAGYNPVLFLGDFTGDRVSDIYVSIDSGGSGGYGFFYIYSFLSNVARKVFDFEEFNNRAKYQVSYRDNYAVDVVNRTTDKLFGIDIYPKGSEYLDNLYDENGKLKAPVEGDVLAIADLYPIDLDKDGVFELEAVQRIIGISNADTLGYVKTYLDWNGLQIAQSYQQVCVDPVKVISAYTKSPKHRQEKPPTTPPPAFIPAMSSLPDVNLTAVDPGAIKPCLKKFVYIWMDNGQSFWAYLTYIGKNSVAGWRYFLRRWVYFAVDLKDIKSFICY